MGVGICFLVLAEERPCTAVWDGWTCFPSAQAGSVVTMPCSSQAYSSSARVCTCKCFDSTYFCYTDLLAWHCRSKNVLLHSF